MEEHEMQRDREVIAAASSAREEWGGVYGDGSAGILMATGPGAVSLEQAEKDAEFIRRARDRWLLVLDEVERLRADR